MLSQSPSLYSSKFTKVIYIHMYANIGICIIYLFKYLKLFKNLCALFCHHNNYVVDIPSLDIAF